MPTGASVAGVDAIVSSTVVSGADDDVETETVETETEAMTTEVTLGTLVLVETPVEGLVEPQAVSTPAVSTSTA
jgi:hypothetical protein